MTPHVKRSANIMLKSCLTCIDLKECLKNPFSIEFPRWIRSEIICPDCNNLNVFTYSSSSIKKRSAEIVYETYLKEWHWYCVSLTSGLQNGWHRYLKNIGIEVGDEFTERENYLIMINPDWVFRKDADAKFFYLYYPVDLAEKIAIFKEMPPCLSDERSLK